MRALETSSALTGITQEPRRTATGSLVLEWPGLKEDVLYRTTVSRDSEGTQVLRKYLTADPRVDLHAIRSQLEPGRTYFWWVQAVSADGRRVSMGPRQRFVLAAPESAAGRPQAAASSALAPLPLASLIASRSPEPRSTVAEVRPVLTVELRAALNASRLVLILDDTDITSVLQINGKTISYTPVRDLGSGVHTVRLLFGMAADTWTFVVQGQPGAAPSDAQVQTQLNWNNQRASGPGADTNVYAFAKSTVYRDGFWSTDFNGLNLLNAAMAPGFQQVQLGRFNDYFFRVTWQEQGWGGNMRFGALGPELFMGSQFVNVAPQEGAETSLRTPAGTFAYYMNTGDSVFDGTVAAFRPRLAGGSWTAPLPKQRAEFRFMWLTARQARPGTDASGNLLNTPDPLAAAGDMYEGGTLKVQLNPKWQWSSEFARVSYNTNLSDPAAQRWSSRAWRTGLNGTWAKTQIVVIYRDFGRNFITPTSPSMSYFEIPDRRGVEASASRPTKAGTFSLGYNFQLTSVGDTTRPSVTLHNLNASWSKNFGPKTVLAIQAHEVRTFNGTLPASVLALEPDQRKWLEKDQRDLGFNANLSRTVGKMVLTLGGSRGWLHDGIWDTGNFIRTSMQVGANWKQSSFFQLNTSFSMNWAAGEKMTVGATRVMGTSVEPMLTWRRTELSIVPLLSLNRVRTELANGTPTADQFSGLYGGRVSWKMPGKFRFSTLSCEGNLGFSHNNIWATTYRDARLLVLWTMVWGYDRSL